MQLPLTKDVRNCRLNHFAVGRKFGWTKLASAMHSALLQFTAYALLFGLFSALAISSDSNQTRTLSGHEIGHYKNGAVPTDLSTVAIAALVPNGSGYTTITGTGSSDGKFTIPDVPTGFYLLQIGTSYLWTSNTMVDADSNYGYRSTVVPANSSTQISLDFTNLDAWRIDDFFEIVCPHNDSYVTTDDYLYGGVSMGATSFTGTYTLGPSWILSDASLGDQYYAAELVPQSVGGYGFLTLARYYAPPKFTQAQGSDTPIDGKLKTIPQTKTFEANINGADLVAQAVAANPAATLDSGGCALDAYPGSLAKGQTTDTPDLVFCPPVTTNGDLGPVPYGDPYPASWPLFVGYFYSAYTNYLAPGATGSASIVTFIQGYTVNLPSTTSPITPLIGVAQNPTINGEAFFTNQTGVGLTPLLQWSAPAVGTATYYVVSIYQLFNSGGNTVYSPLPFSFSTAQTSLRIPGVLTAGQARRLLG
jgi:hypothetical protein